MKIWSVGASVSGFEISYRLTREVWIKKNRTFTRNYWWCFNGWLGAAQVGIWTWNSFKIQAGALGLCTWKAVLPLSQCQEQDGSILGCPHGTGFVKSVQRNSTAFWEKEFCSLAFCYLYYLEFSAWTAVVCLLQDKWASFSNLCTNDVPQSNFSNFQTAGLRLCAGHFCSENDSPFSSLGASVQVIFSCL